MEVFFSQGLDNKYGSDNQVSAVSDANITTLFKKYAGNSPTIGEDQILKFFEDIGVNAEDPITLAISYFMEAKTQGELTLEMFKKGCHQAKADKVTSWKEAIPSMKAKLQSNSDLFE